MIVSEKINDKLIRHYSDEDKKIRQIETGRIYVEAVDVIPCRYTYEEVEEVPAEDTATDTDFKAALESLGVKFNV